jgi:hypothetical protein
LYSEFAALHAESPVGDAFAIDDGAGYWTTLAVNEAVVFITLFIGHG